MNLKRLAIIFILFFFSFSAIADEIEKNNNTELVFILECLILVMMEKDLH